MLRYIREEHVLCQAFVQATLALLGALGCISVPVRSGAIVAFSAAFLGILTRSQVTPIANPKLTSGAARVSGAATVGVGH